ncbi:hypothetical protein Ancab_008309, partial [Ancistrocladus abbreviatus]
MVGWQGLGKLWKGVVMPPITVDAVDASGLFLQVCAPSFCWLSSPAAVFWSLGVSEVAVGKGVFCGLLPVSLGWHVHPSIDGNTGRVLAAQCDAEAEWMQWVLGGCSYVLVVSPSWLSCSNWLVNSFVLVVGLAGVW